MSATRAPPPQISVFSQSNVHLTLVPLTPLIPLSVHVKLLQQSSSFMKGNIHGSCPSHLSSVLPPLGPGQGLDPVAPCTRLVIDLFTVIINLVPRHLA